MKKLLALVLALVMVLALVACGGGKTESAPAASSAAPPAASQQQPSSTPEDDGNTQTSDAAVAPEAPAVTVSMPENLKLTYSIDAGDTRTIIKIGDDYYSCYKQHGADLVASNSYFFKHNSDGTWTQYIYNSGWQATPTAWTDPTDGFGGLESSNFYWHVLLETQYISQYGAPVESASVLSRPVKVYEGWADTVYYADDETGLIIKGTDGSVAWEVVEWDTSVTDFGDVQIPE